MRISATPPRTLTRRVLTAALGIVMTASAWAAAAVPMPDEMSLGSPGAKVTVTEYASLGCPHCAAWEQKVFPDFKKTFIDTGKVRFVLKEMLFGNSTLAAAGFLTARCAGPAKYFQVVDQIFDQQAQIEEGGVKEMLKVAQAAGMNEDQFKACLQDQAALDALQARSNRYMTDEKITGTPTFVVGTQKLEGDQTFAALSAAIEAARKP